MWLEEELARCYLQLDSYSCQWHFYSGCCHSIVVVVISIVVVVL